MALAYHPDFGQPVNYRFEDLPEDPDRQVEITVARVCDYLRRDAESEPVREMARRALALSPDPILATWNSIKPHIRFRNDADIARDLGVNDSRKDDVIEVLIRPVDQALLIMLRGMGVEDCDGFTMYGACLLHAMGVPVNLVTIAAEPEEPRTWSHIYVAAYPNGRRVPLDFSHGPYPGWEGPHCGRIKEWPISESFTDRCTRVGVPVLVAAAGLFVAAIIRQMRVAA